MEKKYKTLKNINAQQLVDKKIDVVRLMWFLNRFAYKSIDPQEMIGTADCFPEIQEKWLIDHGYIEEVKPPKKTYRLHDCFLSRGSGNIYMIIRASDGRYCLSCISPVNTYLSEDLIHVRDSSAITEQEFFNMCGSISSQLTPIKVKITYEPVTE